MKFSKKIFAILFLTGYVLFAGKALLSGAGHVFGAMIEALPYREGVQYYSGLAAKNAFPLRTALLEDHARLQRLMGKTESGGLAVIETVDGAYVQGEEAAWDTYSVEQFAAGVYELKEALADRDLATEVIYISAQPQIVRGYSQALESFPLPDEDPLVESLLYYLRAYDVDFLDTQFALSQSDLEPSQYIYKTDTKWTTEASLVTAQALVKKLNDQYRAGISTGPGTLNHSDFTFTTYPDAFLGSMGIEAGEPFTGREDFTTIVPNYETSFTYTAGGQAAADLTGSFTETLFNSEHLEPPDPYLYTAYSVYMDGGAYYQRKIVNNNRPEGPKALFIHDVSALPLASFAALGFSETHMYWPELAAEEDFDVADYVAANDIDYVFFLSDGNFYAMQGVFSVLP